VERSLLEGRPSPGNLCGLSFIFIALGAEGAKDEPIENEYTGDADKKQAAATMGAAT
jgi:hypothetical protein